MANIKDVAKLANVSLGTVSNVLNGKSVVSQKNVDKVMSAVKELDYRPDAKARSLKTNKTYEVGVILPNILDKKYAHIYSGIERTLTDNGYLPNLYITSEFDIRENSIFELLYQHRTDGIILVSCQTNKSGAFEKLKNGSIPIVTVEREIAGTQFDFIGFNNSSSIQELVSYFLKKDKKNFLLVSGPSSFSNEEQCQQSFIETLNNIEGINQTIIETNQDKESAFRELMLSLNKNDLPEVIISTSSTLIEGIEHAIYKFCGGKTEKPLIAGICVESWSNDSSDNILKVKQRPIELGVLAAEKLLDKMEQSTFSEPYHQLIENNRLQVSQDIRTINIGTKKTKPIRVMMLEGSASASISSLISGFERLSNNKTEIITYPFEKLYKEVIKGSKNNYHDVFMVDNPWISDLVEDKCLLNLNSFLNDNTAITGQFIPGVLDAYSRYRNNYYALPFVFGTQLLFYRKDLFSDTKYQLEFFKLHQKKLRPPENWVEFNAVARFFTKNYNSNSPVEYGTTLGANEHTSAVCEYLPRLWAFNGEIFSNEGIPLNPNRPAEIALQNYLESFNYAAPGSVNHHWSEQVAQFNEGMAAMMVMFVAHAMDVGRKRQSNIAGKVGYGLIPGKNPILGGWSLAINNKTTQPDEAFKFIEWATGKDLAIPYSILGGTTPCLDFYKSSELLQVYPWLTKSIESFNICKRRTLPSNLTSKLKVREYECILGDVINRVVKKELSVVEGVDRLEHELNQTIDNNIKTG